MFFGGFLLLCDVQMSTFQVNILVRVSLTIIITCTFVHIVCGMKTPCMARFTLSIQGGDILLVKLVHASALITDI